ncbi:RusA family crossover junction endodeoxyribonuclease [Comamonas fluminis]|uniref:RusA family crossover junction endodeoxyribonuclease n=1 Tax=Comamonas fluminis TaxID=2796366 RepID=UPI001FEA30B9|nr:RusA family crossover junction endodeoxyribonuclease [Comamonas fluminis]
MNSSSTDVRAALAAKGYGMGRGVRDTWARPSTAPVAPPARRSRPQAVTKATYSHEVGRRLTFEVPGTPVAKGRHRTAVVKNRVRNYTPEKTANYEAYVAGCAKQAMAGRPMTDGPVALSVTAYFSIPSSWPKKRQAAARAGELRHIQKPDIDNLLKSLKDGMNGVVWKDDCQVCELHNCSKGYCDSPRVVVTVEEI